MGRLKFLAFTLVYSLLNRIDLRYVSPFKVLSSLVEQGRVVSLRGMGCRIGKSSFVRSRSFITTPSMISIGKNSKVGPYAELWSYGGIEIGDDVEIGSRLVVHTDEHRIDDPGLPLTKQGSVHAKVIVGDDVYIGSSVTILSGVTIGNRVIVAAGSVVIKDLESGYLYAGVPATKKRKIN
ncbi:MAG: acyltransferase [Hahellaceae bacterium]|nr:acyltransferase [Hahellaceae bacterium]